MSSRSREDYICPVCCDIFRDPLVLSCGHSFCATCLQQCWKSKLECPLCKRPTSRGDMPRNFALKNLCEAFLQENEHKGSGGSGSLCSLHSEKLSLFCLDHKEAVCLICRDSKRHTQHTFRPMNEAAQDHREELRKFVKLLQEKVRVFEQVKESCHQTAKHARYQFQHTERLITKEFLKIHQFLKEEEKARIAALREEEVRKSLVMKEKIDGLNREIIALLHMITTTEKELKADDTSLMQCSKATVKRAQQHLLADDPQLYTGAVIDVAKHVGNLTFNVWSKMKETVSYTPVVLDPNTADPELTLSEDLLRMRVGRLRRLPKNPERTKYPYSVLGSHGFNSGTHCWDIDVGDNKDWELGVSRKYMQQNEYLQSGRWRIVFSGGKLSALSTSDSKRDLSPKKHLKKIRVQLDFDGGQLTFIDLDTKTHIYTFKHRFTDTLFPYFCTRKHCSLKILPVKVYVTLQMHT